MDYVQAVVNSEGELLGYDHVYDDEPEPDDYPDDDYDHDDDRNPAYRHSLDDLGVCTPPTNVGWQYL